MKHLISFLLAAFILNSCALFDKKEQTIVPLIEGIPTIKSLTDSLNKISATSAKWAVSGEKILSSIDQKIDWQKEFEVFEKANVNQIRYRDAYSVSDTAIGKTRTLVFTAKDKSQEIQKMEIHLVQGSIVYYEVEKSRKTIFSNSNQRFVFDGNEYMLDVDQQIEGVFSNQQYVHGTILSGTTIWRGTFDIGSEKIPVQALINLKEKTFFLKNSTEIIGFNKFEQIGDTLVFASDFFDSRFHVKPLNDSTLHGRWINDKRETSHSIPFEANANIAYRFTANMLPKQNLSGYHKTYFYTEDEQIEDSTLLKIDQNQHMVSGSILTETGDYRFLEGVVRNDSVLMSTMDGTHVYSFTAAIEGDQLKGVFKSGCCYQQNWTATLNSSFELRDPEVITKMLPDSIVSFSFPDQNGKLVSINDKTFSGKPMVVSLMGTWCSNCLDEAQFLKEAESIYGSKGLMIVALDFELINDSARAFENINRHRESLGINYPVLLACLGSTKSKAHEQLPFLNGIYSYPTMIILDKNHEVVKIHTGFNGPATGPMHYDAFRMEYLGLFDDLTKQ